MKYFLESLGLPRREVHPTINAGPRPVKVQGRIGFEASLPAPLADAPAPTGGVAYKEAAHAAVLQDTIRLANANHRATQENG